MISISEESHKNPPKIDDREEFSLLINSDFWLYLPLITRKNILRLLDDCPHEGAQAQLPYN